MDASFLKEKQLLYPSHHQKLLDMVGTGMNIQADNNSDALPNYWSHSINVGSNKATKLLTMFDRIAQFTI